MAGCECLGWVLSSPESVLRLHIAQRSPVSRRASGPMGDVLCSPLGSCISSQSQSSWVGKKGLLETSMIGYTSAWSLRSAVYCPRLCCTNSARSSMVVGSSAAGCAVPRLARPRFALVGTSPKGSGVASGVMCTGVY